MSEHGNQIAGVLLGLVSRERGMHWAHVISLVAAGLLSVWAFQHEDMFKGIFFALFALFNFRILQAHHHAAKYGTLEDDADWWKR